MKVQAKQDVEVTLSDETLKNVAINFLLSLFDWKKNYIVGPDYAGELWVWDKQILYTTHAFEDKQKVREASADDMLIYSMLSEIQIRSKNK